MKHVPSQILSGKLAEKLQLRGEADLKHLASPILSQETLYEPRPDLNEAFPKGSVRIKPAPAFNEAFLGGLVKENAPNQLQLQMKRFLKDDA